MVGSHEADDNRLTGRVVRARPTDHLPVVTQAPEEGAEGTEASPDDTSDADQPVAPAEPEIETVTKLMGFLRNSDG